MITGATNKKQLDENIAAGKLVDKLSDDVLERIELILDNQPEED